MKHLTMFEKSLHLAQDAHFGQTRRGGTPYIIHPLKVVDQLRLWGFDFKDDESLFVIALLHDVIEDTVITREDIESEFSLWIADKVADLSYWPNKGSKREYLEKLCHPYQDIEVLLVKIADRICNITDNLKDKKYNKAAEGWKEALPLRNAIVARQKLYHNKYENIKNSMDQLDRILVKFGEII